MIRSLSLLMALALAAPCLALEPVANTTGPTTEEGFVDLLAGDALQTTWRGFRKETTPDTWVIEDGVLLLKGKGGGDLVTREEYADFDLRFEWKVVEHGNSGVHYRATEETGWVSENAIEYQVLDPEYPNINEWQTPGALYALYPVPKSKSRAAGEWNTGRIVANGATITHWLNGEKVVEAVLDSPLWKERLAASKFATMPQFAKSRSGRLALQDHGTGVWYRNMRIKRLEAE